MSNSPHNNALLPQSDQHVSKTERLLEAATGIISLLIAGTPITAKMLGETMTRYCL